MIDVDVHRRRQKNSDQMKRFFGKYKATAVKPSTLVDVCGGWWMVSSPPFAFSYYYHLVTMSCIPLEEPPRCGRLLFYLWLSRELWLAVGLEW